VAAPDLDGPDAIPLMRPQLPPAAQLAPYLAEIDRHRWYTNFGPLVTRLEERLAGHFGLPPANAVIVANGTTALSASLLAVNAAPGSLCLLPSWTFVASAAAVWAANLRPHFVDVSPGTWQPDPAALRERRDLAEVGAVMIVSPFGAPVGTAEWDRFSADTGIPVIIDGAASFDTVASLAAARPGTSPLMISLHATKVFGIGEGGLVLARSEPTIHRIRQVANFGIWGSRDDQVLGYNGKVSEYHAAVGLAAYDVWPARRAELQHRTQRYISELRRLPDVDLLPGYGEGWVSAYCTVRVPGNVDAVVANMKSQHIETRRWWYEGVHAQAAYRGYTHDELPATEAIAARAISLPFYHDIEDEQIVRVVAALEQALRASV
jgi:dTDP-4-amino-4,6-dideoxygalactose transaminase